MLFYFSSSGGKRTAGRPREGEDMSWPWLNIPLMAVFFAAWTGIPIWLSIRHPDTGPVTLTASSPADEAATVASLQPDAELVGQS